MVQTAMAKKKTEVSKGKRKQVTIDDDLHRKGTIVATQMGISFPDYLCNLVRPTIERAYIEAVKQMGLELGEK